MLLLLLLLRSRVVIAKVLALAATRLATKHVGNTTHNSTSKTSLTVVRVLALAGTAMVVLGSGGLLLRGRVHEARSQLSDKLSSARLLASSASTATTASAMRTTKELARKTAKVTSRTRAVA